MTDAGEKPAEYEFYEWLYSLPIIWERPRLHFYETGNYVACNQYWSLGMDCPHHEDGDKSGQKARRLERRPNGDSLEEQ